ncbi:MAG TPA: competence protein CoiA family protein, partial [Flavisolibacter sp.]|nr:competence protein CoiA family protein [Flavisolibacter sp.]
MPFKLPYGLKDEFLVTIDQVESGLACRCVCPCCGERLLAKKGKTILHHFAHYHSPECRGGLETPLHRLCKEIIQQQKVFTLPPYFSSRGKKMSEAVSVSFEKIYL